MRKFKNVSNGGGVAETAGGGRENRNNLQAPEASRTPPRGGRGEQEEVGAKQKLQGF